MDKDNEKTMQAFEDKADGWFMQSPDTRCVIQIFSDDNTGLVNGALKGQRQLVATSLASVMANNKVVFMSIMDVVSLLNEHMELIQWND